MSNKKTILKISSISLFLSSLLSAATPNTPGPYVGVYDVNETTARISFLDNSSNEDGFKVYIHDSSDVLDTAVAPNPIVVQKNDGGNLHQYANISGLMPDTIYKLRVTAFNADGESAPTISSSVNNGRIHTSGSQCTVPSMPGEYVGTYNVTDTSVRISFLDNSNNETGFKIYIYEYDTNTLVKTLTVPALSGMGEFQYANIDGLTQNTLYRVAVTAIGDCGESNPTHASSVNNGRFRTTGPVVPVVTCPAMPGEYVGVYNATSNSARISFIDNSNNETGFKVYVYDTAKTLLNTITLTSKNGIGSYQYANITGLTANTNYTVGVSAFNASCESNQTNAGSTTNGRITTTP